MCMASHARQACFSAARLNFLLLQPCLATHPWVLPLMPQEWRQVTPADRAPQPLSKRALAARLQNMVRQGGPPGAQANALLTSQIKLSRTWQDAFSIFVSYSHLFNAVNTSALLHHMAKLVQARGWVASWSSWFSIS